MLRTATFKLALVYLATFVLITSAVVAYLFWNTNNLLTGQVLQTIAAEVKGLREQFEVGGNELLARTVAERSRQPGNALYYLGTPGNRAIAGNLSQRPAEISGDASGGLFSYTRRIGNRLEQNQAVGVSINVPGGLVLVVGRDVEAQRAFANDARSKVLIGFGLVTLFGLLGGWWFSRRLLSQIDDVTARSRAIIRGDLSERIPLTGSGDEFDRLATNLNRMHDRIEELLNGFREVSDNIAHDLKTPLNRLRNRVEIALRNPSGAPAWKEACEDTLIEADELIKTFNALLSIARLEAGAQQSRPANINLTSIVEEVTELYEPVVEESGFTLRVKTSEPLMVSADRQLISQALVNLIENAMKYGGAKDADQNSQGDISVDLTRVNGNAVLSVADNGPGIPAEDRDRALKRFVRLEASRSKPGSGLGLSLVAAVVQMHHGQIELGDNAPGLKVTMRFPLAA